MTSVPGTDSLAWTDEQTRFYLKLRVEEKLKGNERKGNLNDVGRQSIIDKFCEVYGERHAWRKFGIKHTTCKTQYSRFKRLINKRTGLGYDANGYVNMSDDWWDQLCKSILRLLIEDDELDLLFDENQYMCALLEEMGGATEADADRQLVRTNRGEGWRRVQRFMNGSEVQCYEILRMNQETFKSLCKVLSEKYGLKETHNVFVEESVAMFLETVGQDATVRAIAEHYQHSTDTVKRKLEQPNGEF